MGTVVFLLLQAPFTGVVPSFVEGHALVVGAGVGAFGLIAAAGAPPSSSSLDSPKNERWFFRGGFGDGFARGLFQDK